MKLSTAQATSACDRSRTWRWAKGIGFNVAHGNLTHVNFAGIRFGSNQQGSRATRIGQSPCARVYRLWRWRDDQLITCLRS